MLPQIVLPRNLITKGYIPSLTWKIKDKTIAQTVKQQKTFISTGSEDNDVPIPYSRDMIGPAHHISNIRKICFHKPLNETKLQKKYRLLRQDTLEWSHKFWLNHNSEFAKERDEYTKKILKERNLQDDPRTTLNADEMSEFYKEFLDRKWSSHIQYNIEWQKRNFSIIFLSILVGIQNIVKRS